MVSSVGAGVTRFNVGDEVYGCFGGIVGDSGALADQMEADAEMLALKPKSLSFGGNQLAARGNYGLGGADRPRPRSNPMTTSWCMVAPVVLGT